MMVHTRYGKTDTLSGEIIEKPLDLQPLRHKPRGRVSRPERSYQQRRQYIQLDKESAWVIVIAAFVLGVCIG